MDYQNNTGEDYPDTETDDGSDVVVVPDDLLARIARDGFIWAERIA